MPGASAGFHAVWCAGGLSAPDPEISKLRELRALGFQPCKYLVTKQKLTLENVEAGIYQLRQYATDKDIPIDGIVVSFNDIAYAQTAAAPDITIRTVWPISLKMTCMRACCSTSNGRRAEPERLLR